MVQPIDFDESLQRLQFIFRCSGLTVESKKVTRLTKLKKRCVYMLNLFWLNSDVLGGIYWFVDGVRTGKTFVELTFIAPCVTFSFLANLKTIFLIHYEDSVCDLIEQLRKLDREGVVDIDNLKTGSREKIVFRNRIKGNVNLRKRQNNDYKGVKSNDKVTKDNMRREYIEFLHSVLKCSNILSVALVAMFTTTPLILIALKYYQTKEVELVLPFLIIYPFDSHDIRYWPFVYLHQFWSVSVVLLNICAADNLLYICCTYLGVQFHVLQYDIENVVEKNCVLMDHELEEFQEKYVQLINRHQELIRLTSMLDFVYAKSTLFNFVFSSVLICLTGFNVIAMENVALAVSFLVFLSANLLQIFMLCFFGDFLMKSSIEVSDAVYHSKWYYLNAKSGKNLLIVQTRAQKPCKLTAFGFSDVNLKAFINVLSNAWSYFVLLKTVYSPPKN